MKDGRTHLAPKGRTRGLTRRAARSWCERPGDTTTIAETVTVAAADLEAVATVTDDHATAIDEVVATDKGCHTSQGPVELAAHKLRTQTAEPACGRSR
jgi:hypothetical protein